MGADAPGLRPGRAALLGDGWHPLFPTPEAYAEGRLDPSALVTHRISLGDVPAAFERMQRGEGGRSLVVMRH